MAPIASDGIAPGSAMHGLAAVRMATQRQFWMYVLTQIEHVEESKAENQLRFWEDSRSKASSVHGRSLVLSLANTVGLLSPTQLAKYVAERHGLPLLPRDKVKASLELVRQIGEERCKHLCIVPMDGGRVAVADPEMQGLKNELRRALKGDIIYCVASLDDIRGAQDKLHEAERLLHLSEHVIADVADATMIEADLQRAFYMGASDLHLKPGEHAHIVTARIDGDCQEFRRLTPDQKDTYLHQLKLSSRRGLNGENLPDGTDTPRKGPRNRAIDPQNVWEAQDGASVREYNGHRVALRYSTIPCPMGESVAIRFIDHSRIISLHLDGLGYLPADVELMREAFRAPTGLNMLLGTTGSGKSTTLYTGIKEIDMDKCRVVTIEDPIECLFPEGPIQIELNELLSFAKIKSAVMRHDPDAIIVAEVRDLATVQLLEWATLSSHLTWGTLHAGSPFLAIQRLIELGLDVRTLSGVVDTFCAQVLGRRVCKECRKPVSAARQSMYMDVHRATLEAYWAAGGQRFEPQFFEANRAGCPHCKRGEKGRTLFAEIYKFDDEDRDRIARESKKYNAVAARKRACERVHKPLKTLQQDAVIKAAMGWVSIDEAMSATVAGNGAAE